MTTTTPGTPSEPQPPSAGQVAHPWDGLPLNPDQNGAHQLSHLPGAQHHGPWALLWCAPEKLWTDLYGNRFPPEQAAQYRYVGPMQLSPVPGHPDTPVADATPDWVKAGAPSLADHAIVELRELWDEDDAPCFPDVEAAVRRFLASDIQLPNAPPTTQPGDEPEQINLEAPAWGWARPDWAAAGGLAATWARHKGMEPAGRRWLLSFAKVCLSEADELSDEPASPTLRENLRAILLGIVHMDCFTREGEEMPHVLMARMAQQALDALSTPVSQPMVENTSLKTIGPLP